MRPAHAAHRNRYKHPENTTEARALMRRDGSGSRRLGSALPLPTVREPSTAGGVAASCTPWLHVVPCPGESSHHSPLPGPLGPGSAVGAMSWGHCSQEQPGVKEKSWSLSELAFSVLLSQRGPRELLITPRSNCPRCLLAKGCPSPSTCRQDAKSGLLELFLPHPGEDRGTGHGGTHARQLLSCPTQPQCPHHLPAALETLPLSLQTIPWRKIGRKAFPLPPPFGC